LEYFRAEQDNPETVGSLEIEYGIALTLARMGDYKEAEELFAGLLATNEELIPLYSGLAQTRARLGDREGALGTFRQALALFPRNVPLTVRYAETLIEYGNPKEAHRILLDLLNQVPPTLEQIRLIAIAANNAGDIADAHYYMAEYHAMSGNLRLAIEQLRLALTTPKLDSVQRARFRARMEQFQEFLPGEDKEPSRRKRNRDK
jgi:predicted Zn-dependent protease